VAVGLAAATDEILAELAAAQGSPQDLGGYYMPDQSRAGAAMRPSARLNSILDEL
jgi:isocitrate dehydrogenase